MNLTKQSILEKLMSQYQMSVEELGGKSKGELLKILQQKDDTVLLDKAKPEIVLVPNADLNADLSSEESKPEVLNDAPARYSDEWSDWLLGQLQDKEKVNDRPTCDGLRRLFNKFVGRILNLGVDVIQAPDVRNLSRSTVRIRIDYLDVEDKQMCHIEDVADCDTENTDAPFNLYTTATAMTMAESRAMRKRLGIRAIAYEESKSPESFANNVPVSTEGSTQMTSIQKKSIEILATKMGIDINALLENNKDSAGTAFEELSYKSAQSLLRELNEYQRGPSNKGLAIPDSILLKPASK